MKFNLVVSVILFCSTVLFAQQKDSLGLYNIALLNQQESEFFKDYFEDENIEFDFAQRKLAYYSEEALIKDKSSFFKWVRNQKANSQEYFFQIIILDEKEQRDLGRFDAIIIVGLHQEMTDELRQQLLKKIQTNKACSLC